MTTTSTDIGQLLREFSGTPQGAHSMADGIITQDEESRLR